MTIRLTDHPPAQCAVCFSANHDPGFRHVDFDAAADRGYGSGPVPISMDEIIVCENCVREGARLIDMEDAMVLARRVTHLQQALIATEKERDRWMLYADKIDEAFNVRPPDDQRKRPRKPVAA